MDTLKEFLKEIGFGKNEAEVYTALVEIGDVASVLDLSKKTKIHRSNIYDALRRLVEEGFIFEINKEKKMFKAREPRSLIHFVKRKEMELQDLIKDFESKKTFKKDNELVKFSKGIFALREAIESLLSSSEPVDVFGIPPQASDIIGPMLKDFHKERIGRKIRMRHIYNASAIKRVKWLNSLNYTEARILPKKYDSNVTTNVQGDKVMIFVWGDQIEVIEIVNEEIAKTYQNYFNILWTKSKPIAVKIEPIVISSR
ncbi:MAG: hypothetical protein RL557_493 [archaeon]